MSILRTNTDAKSWLSGYEPEPVVPRLVRVMKFLPEATRGLKKRKGRRK